MAFNYIYPAIKQNSTWTADVFSHLVDWESKKGTLSSRFMNK